MLDISTFDFMKYVLLGALFASVACGIVGTLIVVNRLVFLAGGIAHAAYGGVGISIYFNLPLLPSVLVFSIICSQILGHTTSRSRYKSDAMVGIIWAVGMSIGALLVNLSPGYHADVMGYLFGSILTIVPKDIIIIGLLDLLLVWWTILFYGEILAVSYDPEFAIVSGIKARLFYQLILLFSAITVVVLMRFVGLILVIALLSIPSYIAEDITASLKKMFAVCALLTLTFLIAGLAISVYLDLQPGPTIIISATVMFILVKIANRIVAKNKSNF